MKTPSRENGWDFGLLTELLGRRYCKGKRHNFYENKSPKTYQEFGSKTLLPKRNLVCAFLFMEEKNKFEQEMEKMRIAGLENMSRNLLKTTPRGRIILGVYFLIAFGSIFLYAMVFKFSIWLSLLFALITWIVVKYLGNKIVMKVYRIDKQYYWLLNTPEGLDEMKKKGMTDEQIAELRKEVEGDVMYKKYSLDRYKK